jgi:hypothetical protein
VQIRLLQTLDDKASKVIAGLDKRQAGDGLHRNLCIRQGQ